jgi:hypothetical protein
LQTAFYLNKIPHGCLNGDGIDDLIIAVPGVDANSISYGTSYVLFGGTTIGSGGSFDLSNLDGSNSFVIDGIDAFDNSGFSVRVSGAGDINNDLWSCKLCLF